MAGLTDTEKADATATVAAFLDQSLPLYHATITQGASGNTVETYGNTPNFLLPCNIFKPSAEILTVYADVIAGRRALMLRYMPTQDVHEGDRIVYQGLNWRVQPVETAESFTFANDVLITTVT